MPPLTQRTLILTQIHGGGGGSVGPLKAGGAGDWTTDPLITRWPAITPKPPKHQDLVFPGCIWILTSWDQLRSAEIRRAGAVAVRAGGRCVHSPASLTPTHLTTDTVSVPKPPRKISTKQKEKTMTAPEAEQLDYWTFGLSSKIIVSLYLVAVGRIHQMKPSQPLCVWGWGQSFIWKLHS